MLWLQLEQGKGQKKQGAFIQKMKALGTKESTPQSGYGKRAREDVVTKRRT